MAKSTVKPSARVKQTTVITRSSDDADGGEVTIGGDDQPTPDALAALLGLEASGVTYKVYRLGEKPTDKPFTYCAAYDKDSLSLETIRDTFGGGTYRISATDAQNKFVDQKTVSIFGFAKTAAPAAAPAADTSMLTVLMGLIQSQGTMIAAALARPEAAAPKGPTAMEIVQMIKALEPREKSDPIEMLLKGLTLGKELNSDGGMDLMSLAGKGLDAVKPLIAAQAAGQIKAPPAPSAPNPRAALPPTAAPAPAQPKTPEEMQTMIDAKKLTWITHMTAQLVAWAQRGKNSELYAEVFLDNLPPFITIDEIEARFSDPQSISQLALLNPAVPECAAWIEEFRQHVIELLHQDDEPDDDEGDEEEEIRARAANGGAPASP